MVKKQESLKWKPKVSFRLKAREIGGGQAKASHLNVIEEIHDGVKKPNQVFNDALKSSTKIIGTMDHETNVTPRSEQTQGEPGGPKSR